MFNTTSDKQNVPCWINKEENEEEREKKVKGEVYEWVKDGEAERGKSKGEGEEASVSKIWKNQLEKRMFTSTYTFLISRIELPQKKIAEKISQRFVLGWRC